jgi:hypothetical protein
VSKQQKIIEKKAKEAGASERKRSKGQKDWSTGLSNMLQGFSTILYRCMYALETLAPNTV